MVILYIIIKIQKNSKGDDSLTVPSRKLTWKTIEGSIKRIVTLKGASLHFHVNLEECTSNKCTSNYQGHFEVYLKYMVLRMGPQYSVGNPTRDPNM